MEENRKNGGKQWRRNGRKQKENQSINSRAEGARGKFGRYAVLMMK